MMERIICGLVGLVAGAVLVGGLLAVTDTSASDLAAATKASDDARAMADQAAEQRRQRAAQLTSRVTELERQVRERDAAIASQTPAARDARTSELEQQVKRLESQLAMANNRIKTLETPPAAAGDEFDYADGPRQPRAGGPGRMSHDGFSFGNISFSASGVIGEVTNERGEDYDVCSFDLSIYDGDGALVEVAPIVVNNFGAGETKGFRCFYRGGLPPGGSFKIQTEHALE